MSSTKTIAITRTHTATYLGAKIAAAFRDILTEIGLRAEALNYDWSDLENAMRIWMNEGSFREARIFIIDKASGKVLRHFAVPVSYLGVIADSEFGHDLETVKRAIKKAALASGSRLGFAITVWNHPWRSAVPGWGPAPERDISHLSKRSMGQLAFGPGMTCDLHYWTPRASG